MLQFARSSLRQREKRRTCWRSSVRAATWRVVAGCAGLFITATAGCVSAQEVFLDLVRALQNVAERSAGTSERQPFPPTEPARFTENSPTHGTHFVLSGGVIAGDTRLALIEDASARPAPPTCAPPGANPPDTGPPPPSRTAQ